MNELPEGNAIIYCEGAFNTTNGKTAHGLVRFTDRYRVLSVIDSRYAGQDAGELVADAFVLTEHEADFATAHTNIAGRHVGHFRLKRSGPRGLAAVWRGD